MRDSTKQYYQQLHVTAMNKFERASKMYHRFSLIGILERLLWPIRPLSGLHLFFYNWGCKFTVLGHIAHRRFLKIGEVCNRYQIATMADELLTLSSQCSHLRCENEALQHELSIVLTRRSEDTLTMAHLKETIATLELAVASLTAERDALQEKEDTHER